MDPAAALHSVETVLRLAIRMVLPENEWLNIKGIPTKETLEEKHKEEVKRRGGAKVPSNLIFYVETYHLTKIVEKKWETFSPIFGNLKQTVAYFKIVLDVRNSIAHSRDLLPFERQLLSGVAGHLSNKLSIYRNEVESSMQYYPTIQSVTDSFGRTGNEDGGERMRLDVGQHVRFEGLAVSPRGHDIRWFMSRDQNHTLQAKAWEIGSGLELSYEWTVAESEVGESRTYHIYIVSEDKYHRHDENLSTTLGPYDDIAWFRYSINPPLTF